MKLRKLRIRQRNKWLYFDPFVFRPWLREPVDIAGIPFSSVRRALLEDWPAPPLPAHFGAVLILGKPGTTMSKTLKELVEALK